MAGETEAVDQHGGGDQHGDPIDTRGVYLMADTPMMGHPLALEDGSGDKQLLGEVVAETLSQEELDVLIQDLIEESNERAGNDTEWVAA